MYEEAGAEAEKVMILFGYPAAGARLHGALARPDAKAGIRQMAAETEELMRKKQFYMPYFQASNSACLGDKDRAFYRPQDGHKHHEESWVGIGGPADIKLDPSFVKLRSDPRFKALLRRVGLPP